MNRNKEILDSCAAPLEAFQRETLHAESSALQAMDISNREVAIGFFKWYALKMVGFMEYIKNIRPTVTSNEIEEKIKEFEGKPIDELYNLYTHPQSPE